VFQISHGQCPGVISDHQEIGKRGFKESSDILGSIHHFTFGDFGTEKLIFSGFGQLPEAAGGLHKLSVEVTTDDGGIEVEFSGFHWV